MNSLTSKLKDIIDRDCWERVHAKRCEYNNRINAVNCWLCHRNEPLVQQLMDAVESEKVKTC